ncbi:AraC family transcriptional regulator [Photobacterium jeanii]|uniref:AraC family transcriptional regulator n=1 Tax=Photobacterium jeanii TaxID=858640 RepID=A0A178K3A2_9GAMM|nr:AraC family transcriptional regulator [Photobacterium jeanii]OAN11203.1 AraC family transcriptional regulator [Photobacterium jeanii]PST90723.1 AraC family transcriptional regulator [Photobacterium jeanii]
MFNLSFIRVNYAQVVFDAIRKHFAITAADLGVPTSLLSEPKALVPFDDFIGWFEQAEQRAQDANFMVKLAPSICFSEMGTFGEWYLSSPDLALAVRRINYGTSCLQSGASYHGEQSGKIMKWTYDSGYTQSYGRVLDSLRVAMMEVNALRHYMGADYAPLKIQISGALKQASTSTISKLERWFGCAIEWNAPMTKVWIDLGILRQGSEKAFSISRPMMVSNLQLDDLLNMPQPHDSAKVMFEVVNYARRYGVPKIDLVAKTLGLSKQQLQRRLHQHGWTFSNITQYVICNLAIQYLQAGKPITEIAHLLGYSNPQSFSKAFQRQRGLTPAQYQERLLERSRESLSI